MLPISQIYDLALTKTTPETQVVIGQIIPFDITVINQ